MTVCYFGNYDPDYSRNRILIKGLRQNGVMVVECQTREGGLKKYWSLYQQHRTIQGRYDVLLVGFSGWSVVWFAKLLTRKKIVFDAFSSLYLSEVEDRQNARKGSFKALYYYWLEKISYWITDLVLYDTNAQIEWVVKKFHDDRKKFFRVFVGSDDERYKPMDSSRVTRLDSAKRARHASREKFIVHWHGHIVPFHGIETIIRAAEILKKHQDIQFRLVTRSNHEGQRIKRLSEHIGLTNIEFIPEVGYRELMRLILDADIALGIFGHGLKARVVIPNKIYEAIACSKPVVSGRQAVLEEVFHDGVHLLATVPGDAQDLAEKILVLKNDSWLRESIVRNASRVFEEHLTPKQVGSVFLGYIIALVKGSSSREDLESRG